MIHPPTEADWRPAKVLEIEASSGDCGFPAFAKVQGRRGPGMNHPDYGINKTHLMACYPTPSLRKTDIANGGTSSLIE